MKNQHHFAVIMAGGIGSRFWPMSTSKHPKQFLDVLNCGRSLIRLTYERFAKICPDENILVVTNAAYKGLVNRHLPEIPDDNILLEPVGKNTAPCIAYAANIIAQRDDKGVMVVAPSDHSIGDEEKFAQIIKKSFEYAGAHDVLLTLGITPSRPDTGYGYIQFLEERENEGFYKVKTFTEKPDIATAQQFLDSGEFLWNSGIFIWSAHSILSSFKEHLTDMEKLFSPIASAKKASLAELVEKAYAICTNISIDHGILEKAENVFVMPSSFDWNDVGTWNAIFDMLPGDEQHNVVNTKNTLLRNSSNCLVQTNSKRLIALNNMYDVIVVESDDAILVADRKNEQAIKQLVNELKVKGKGQYT